MLSRTIRPCSSICKNRQVVSLKPNSKSCIQFGRRVAITSEQQMKLKSVQDMPGPSPNLPCIGTAWLYSWIGPYDKDKMLLIAKEELLEKYGPIYKERLGGAWLVNLHDPKHIETVMRNQGKIPMRVVNEANIHWRKSRKDIYKSVGLVDSNGEEWHDLRKKVAPSVLKPQAVSTFVKPLSRAADNFIESIRKQRDTECHLIPDVKEYLFSYGLEAIVASTLGLEAGSLRKHKQEDTKNLIKHSMNLFHSFAELSLSRPWWKIYPTPTFKTFCNSEENIFNIVNRYTQQIINNTKSDNGVDISSDRDTIIKRFLATDNFDHRDVNTVIIDFIAAGIPTTAFFLCLLLHRLGQEKVLQLRLQKELDAAVSDKEITLTDSILKKVPLLNATIHEGFRLTTIIPAIMKILPVDIVCDEYKIPAHTPILCQTRASSLSEKYFTRPKEFIADRWLRNTSLDTDNEILRLQKEAKMSQFLVIPFGFGPRMCVGKRLAEKEIAVLLAKILLNFTLETEGEMELKNCFIIAPKNPVQIKFLERR